MSNLHLSTSPTLEDLQAYVAAMMQERGFEDDELAQRFVMLMEEVGEFAKAARKQAGLKTDQAKAGAPTDTVAHEAADVFIVFLGVCNKLGIDLEKAFREKEAHNKTRTWQ